jgi:hypothetical protein
MSKRKRPGSAIEAMRARTEWRERRDELRREYEQQLRWQHTLYDALKKAADESARALFIWTLHHGTEAQVDSSIGRFFRTEGGKQHSLAFQIDDADDLEEMKTAMEELNVPKERCFWKKEELDKKMGLDIGDYWYKANGLKVKVARLAWLMWCEEKDADFTCVARSE